jgi:hypothetical protein
MRRGIGWAVAAGLAGACGAGAVALAWCVALGGLRLGTRVALPTPVVLRQVQALSRLETVRYIEQAVVTAERSAEPFPSWLLGDRLTLLAHGEVVAGVDLSALRAGDLTVQGDRVSIRLPRATILTARLDPAASPVLQRETGLLNRSDRAMEQQARVEGEAALRTAAYRAGILREARRNAERSVRALLSSAGIRQVEFD